MKRELNAPEHWLDAPEHWLAWLRACQKDTNCSVCEVRGLSLGMITGTDMRVLRAVAALWHLCGYYEDDPGHLAALAAIGSLLPCMQKQCWPFARELIAQALDWKDRERLWVRVVPTL